MIQIVNPYTAQEAATKGEQGTEEITELYGPAAHRQLALILSHEREAFRYGAWAQLLCCVADLRSWAAAYDARATELAVNGDAIGAFNAEYAAKEIRTFVVDWLKELPESAL